MSIGERLTQVNRGEWAGPICRAMAEFGMYVFICVIVILFESRLYIPAVLLSLVILRQLLVLRITPTIFQTLVSVVFYGVSGYLIWIGMWIALLLLGAWWGMGLAGGMAGMHYLKKYPNWSYVGIDPFEGMLDLIPLRLLTITFCVLVYSFSGWMRVLFVMLLFVLMIYYVARFTSRMVQPWRSIHFAAMHRWAFLCGCKEGLRESTGVQLDESKWISNFTKNILPNIPPEIIDELVRNSTKRAAMFSDRPLLAEKIRKNYSIAESKLDDTLTKIQGLLVKHQAIMIIAEIVEFVFGQDKRIDYLYSVVKGEAC
ncbi:MAG: hypothetical protein V1809_15380 [Planctomycetota bacterium]